jgi:hypothetical protein
MKIPLHSLVVLALLSASSCSKKSNPAPDPTPTTPTAPAAGPWDGTYKIESVITVFADTSDYIPYGGNERRIYAGVRADTATAGTLVITRDRFTQNGIFINRKENIQQSTFYNNTGQTVTSNSSSSGQVSTNASNQLSVYTIAGADSVSIADPSVLPLPFGSYPATNPKFKYTFNGTVLTIYNDYYTKQQVTGIDSYDSKKRNQTVAVYRKQ